MELIKIIQYSSSAMGKELIEKLDSESLDSLIGNTISSGRSIGTIPLYLRDLGSSGLLEELEGKVGSDGYMSLITSLGTVIDLTRISRYSSIGMAEELRQRACDLSVAYWQELLLRGDFRDLCCFVRYSSFFSEQLTSDFLRGLRPAFETLVRQGGWETLDRGASFLAGTPDSFIKSYLSTLLYQRIRTVEPGSLEFESFSECFHCIRLLWRRFPSRREELITTLMTNLPENEALYTDAEFMRFSRLLFFMLANPQAAADDARRVLAMGNSKEVADLCGDATTTDLFLYLWNFYSLWFEWKGEEGKTFATFLDPGIHKAMEIALSARFQTDVDQVEMGNLAAMVGLSSFIGLPFSLPEEASMPSTLPQSEELLELIEDKTFVPAVFFLLGLECMSDEEYNAPEVLWQLILPKAEEYDEKTAAVKHLGDLIRIRARR